MKTKGGKRPNSGRKALPYKVVRLQCPEPIAEDLIKYIEEWKKEQSEPKHFEITNSTTGFKIKTAITI
jgi:hypothetical protein